MADEKKNGRLTITQAIALLGLLGAIGGVWGTLAAESADTKRRVDTVEKRQTEDREQVRRDQAEIKDHVKLIDTNVQTILQTIKAMEAVQKTERRERR